MFKIIAKIREAKTLIKDISCDCKFKFNSATCNSNEKWNNKICQCECKNYRTCTKDYSWNPSICIPENVKYLKSIADTSVILQNEIINATDSVSTNLKNTIPANMTNVTSTMSANFQNKIVIYTTDFYILHTVLIVIIFTIAIICYHYAKRRSKRKNILSW